jgi:alpha-N-arabinofuranosidase
MYKVHQDATLLPIDIDCAPYEHDGETIPALSASASRDDAGKIHVSLCNLDPGRAMNVACELRGVSPTRVAGRLLTAGAINAHNTFDQPEAVKPVVLDGVTLAGSTVRYELPAKSVAVLEIE